MFIKKRDEILPVISKLQRKCCCYDSFGYMHTPSGPPLMCDCKYGYTGEHKHGEDTGCPELRCITALLTLMTDIEYEAIMERGKHIL